MGIDISKLKFGKTDAYNEFQDVTADFYKDSFYEFENYQIRKFFDGDAYYIYGDKGTGKTAFLKYMQCKLQEFSENLIIPLRFKSDFDDIDKQNLNRLKNSAPFQKGSVVEQNIIVSGVELTDSVLAWEVYLISRLFYEECTGEYELFTDTNIIGTIRDIFKILFPQRHTSIVPKLKKGNVQLNISLLEQLSILVNFDFDIASGIISYAQLSKSIIEIFKTLHYGRTPCYVLIDELELSILSKKNYDRDVRLVGDLVQAVYNLNAISKQYGFNLKIIASIRTDVLNSIMSSGRELNKLFEDYGVKISWYQRGGDYRNSPILKIIEKKIHASEKKNFVGCTENIWSEYFPDEILRLEPRKFLLDFSWQRPRDIVRLLTLAQKNARAGMHCFTQEILEHSLQDYSKNSWNEILEELRLLYTEEDLSAIEKIFYGIKVPFTLSYLRSRIDELGKLYANVATFQDTDKLVKILEMLFDVGVIGNTGQRTIFKFLGEKRLDLAGDMMIHRPLRNFFSVQSRALHERR